MMYGLESLPEMDLTCDAGGHDAANRYILLHFALHSGASGTHQAGRSRDLAGGLSLTCHRC